MQSARRTRASLRPRSTSPRGFGSASARRCAPGRHGAPIWTHTLARPPVATGRPWPRECWGGLQDDPEPDVVVAVAGVVVVAVGGATVPAVVVPRTATENAAYRSASPRAAVAL